MECIVVRAQCTAPSVTGSLCGGEETVLPLRGSMGWTGTRLGQGCLRCGVHLNGWPLDAHYPASPSDCPAKAGAVTTLHHRRLASLPTATTCGITSTHSREQSRRKGTRRLMVAPRKFTESWDTGRRFVPSRPLQPTHGTHRVLDPQEVVEQQHVRPPRSPAVVQVELRHLPDRSPGDQGEQSDQQAHGIQVKRLQSGGKSQARERDPTVLPLRKGRDWTLTWG